MSEIESLRAQLAAAQALNVTYREALITQKANWEETRLSAVEMMDAYLNDFSIQCMDEINATLATESPTDALRDMLLTVAGRCWAKGTNKAKLDACESIVSEVLGEKP